MNMTFEPPATMGRAIFDACCDPNMGGGILCSGASGSGKTNISEWVFLEFIRRRKPALWFCPHGDSAKKLRRQILMLPKSLRENVLYIRPSDPNRVVSLRPLHVSREGISPYEYRARIMGRVGHVRQLFLASVGEGQSGVVGRPLLRKWLTILLLTAALSGLNVADLVHFLEVNSPAFRLIAQLCPDLVLRSQLEELPEMRPAEREQEISSTRSRLLALFENVVVQMILGRNDDGVLDMNRIIDSGTSIIFDLSRQGMLSHEDQKMIANLYLAEFLHCVMERPSDKRRDYLCCIDELPVFDLSAPLIHDLLCEIRKFRTKFWLSFQGSSRFPGRFDNEFLNTIVSQCRVQLYLSHSAADARFFAQEPALATYDAKRIKHEQKAEQQVHDGHEIVTLVDQSYGTNHGQTEGESEGEARTFQDTWSDQTGISESLGSQIGQIGSAVSAARKESQSHGGSSGTSQNRTRTVSQTIGRSFNRTIKQTLVPILKTQEIVSSVQFYTPEEWTLTFASELTRFNPGECAFYVRGLGVCYGKLPLSVDPLKHTPRTAAKRLAEHDLELAQLPYYQSPEQIDRDRQQFFQELLRQLRRALKQSESGSAKSLDDRYESKTDSQLVLPGLNQDADGIEIPEERPIKEPDDDAPWQF
jgi:hypothetical protein